MQFLLALVLGLNAWAGPKFQPKKSRFREICREYRKDAAGFSIEAPEAGVRSFFPVLALEASQTRFSYTRFLDSMEKARRENDGFSHDRGRSLYGPEKRIKAVFYRGKLYVIDGHHRALISTYLGAKTIPAKIEADLSALSPARFRAEMEKRGWAHWRNYRNQETAPLDLCEMEDDPNFQLARLIIRRVDVAIEDGELVVANSRGSRYPVAVKINGDIPFFENHIADALRRGGVDFDDSRDVDDISKRELAEYIRILREKAALKSSPLAKVLLLDKPRNVAKLDLEELVLNHLRKCERELKP